MIQHSLNLQLSAPGLFLPSINSISNMQTGFKIKSSFSLWIGSHLKRKIYIYLPSGHVVLHWMDGQAEDVVIMPQVEPLGVLLPVVHDSNCSNVVDHFSSLCVEQIVSTVIASIPEAQVKEMHNI